MSPEKILTVVGAGIFVIGAALAAVLMPKRRESSDRWLKGFVLAGAVPVALALILRGVHEGRIPTFGHFEVLACYSLSIVAAYLHAISAGRRLQGVSFLTLGTVAIVLGLSIPGMDPAPRTGLDDSSIMLGLHILTAFVGYGFFTLASILAITYIIQDNNLKNKRFGFVFECLPPLEVLDNLMHRQIAIAFPIFTISLALGVRHAWLMGGGVEWITDPKILATVVTWILYATLIHLRLRADQHGRKLAVVVMIGLACVLFAFVGAPLLTASSVHNFVLPSPGGY